MVDNLTEVYTVPIKSQMFQDNRLNILADHLIELDQNIRTQLQQAEKAMHSAFESMYDQGKLISENYDAIVQECGTQKNFAEKIGKSEAQISNAKRGFEALRSQGCNSFQDVLSLLQERNIRPTARNYEKIGTLLNEPTENTTQIEQESKDRRRMMEIQDEIEEIIRRNERAADPIVQESVTMLDFINDGYNRLTDQDVWTRTFKSERYLDFVRTFGRDVITREPVARCDPHHTDLQGGSGGMGTKLPDWMTIPVSRETHNMLETGSINLSTLDLAKALIETMATYIVNLHDGKHEE